MEFSRRAEREPIQRERRPDITPLLRLDYSLDSLINASRAGVRFPRQQVEGLVQLPNLRAVYDHYQGNLPEGGVDFGNFAPGWNGRVVGLSRFHQEDVHDTHAMRVILRNDRPYGSSRGISIEFQRPYSGSEQMKIEVVDSRLRHRNVTLTRNELSVVFDKNNPQNYILEAKPQTQSTFLARRR